MTTSPQKNPKVGGTSFSTPDEDVVQDDQNGQKERSPWESSNSTPQPPVRAKLTAKGDYGSNEAVTMAFQACSAPGLSDMDRSSVSRSGSCRGALENIRRSVIRARSSKCVERIRITLVKYAKFIGPGFMVSVAYIDPGKEGSSLHVAGKLSLTL